ncbi:MAG TPA: alpha-amylase family glycosyl hydrolase, partial [Candidatus Krumholzibacteria bacterium]|nr:alpha-amylase family glycosyl hydrolase [Candidatus Krumholzibacteria bacterium]
RVAVRLEDDSKTHELVGSHDGFFEGEVKGAGPGTLYKYILDGKRSHPDPASRWQAAGVDGASGIVAPRDFAWTDEQWRGVAKHRLLLYEIHVGTFSAAGTLRAAIERLPKLVELGVTAVELMPVVQTAGRWNWGYDGVDLFAVNDSYGGPGELKAFVDACHARGLAVILDVVYNHLGPEGCVLQDFGPYLSKEHLTPWGAALNFDGEGCEGVRAFILENAVEWLRDYHLDGLRLDSVHHIFDHSQTTVLSELRQRVNEFGATVSRPLHLIFEANVYDEALLQPEDGRPDCDAIWCDDLMHSILTVARPELQLTDRKYEGAEDLARVLRNGRVYVWRDGAPLRVDEPPPVVSSEEEDSPLASLVTSLQNHDGIGNHPQGKRIHQLSSKEYQMAAAVLSLLAPGIPLIFMGEEWAIDTRFPFFCDHQDPELRRLVEQSRAREMEARGLEDALSPLSEESFERARWHESLEGDSEIFDWYRRLIILRKEGLREGWLAMERLQVEHDRDRGIFSLRFTRQYGAAIRARVRLGSTDRGESDPVAVPFSGHVLLSSRGKWEQEEDRLLLHAEHAVVSLETGQRTD